MASELVEALKASTLTSSNSTENCHHALATVQDILLNSGGDKHRIKSRNMLPSHAGECESNTEYYSSTDALSPEQDLDEGVDQISPKPTTCPFRGTIGLRYYGNSNKELHQETVAEKIGDDDELLLMPRRLAETHLDNIGDVIVSTDEDEHMRAEEVEVDLVGQRDNFGDWHDEEGRKHDRSGHCADWEEQEQEDEHEQEGEDVSDSGNSTCGDSGVEGSESDLGFICVRCSETKFWDLYDSEHAKLREREEELKQLQHQQHELEELDDTQQAEINEMENETQQEEEQQQQQQQQQQQVDKVAICAIESSSGGSGTHMDDSMSEEGSPCCDNNKQVTCVDVPSDGDGDLDFLSSESTCLSPRLRCRGSHEDDYGDLHSGVVQTGSSSDGFIDDVVDNKEEVEEEEEEEEDEEQPQQPEEAEDEAHTAAEAVRTTTPSRRFSNDGPCEEEEEEQQQQQQGRRRRQQGEIIPSASASAPPKISPRIPADAQQAYEVFNLKIIHERNKTGLQETKDFRVHEGELIAGRYQVCEQVGEAAFSTALKCVDGITGALVCIKVIKNNKDYLDQSLDEIKLLQLVNDSGDSDKNHILRLLDHFYFKEHLFIVTELMQQNLYEVSKALGPAYFSLEHLQIITKQILEALVFVHGLGLIHCDLKPENILIKNLATVQVKVIDFGSSCFKTDHLTPYIQSRSYRAPEVFLGLPYDERIDLWSLGCILAELYTGSVLLDNDSIQTLVARMLAVVGPIPAHMMQTGRHVSKLFTCGHTLYERLPLPDEMDSNDGVGEYLLYYPKDDLSLDKVLSAGRREQIVAFENEDGRCELVEMTGKNLEEEEKSGLFRKFVDFVQSLLSIDPAGRLTADQALQHPWITYSTEEEEEKRSVDKGVPGCAV